MSKYPKVPKTENHVKEYLKQMLDEIGAAHFAAAASGFSTGGVSDRIVCYKGQFIAIEAKRPGRRGEENEGLSPLQVQFGKDVTAAGGLFYKVDDYETVDDVRKELVCLFGWKDWPETSGQNFIYLVREKNIFVGTIDQDETSGKLTIWNGGVYYTLREPSENFRFKQIDWPKVRQGI